MCGIAGAVWTAAGPPLDEHVLRRMTDLLRHRGPDDAGHYRSAVVALDGQAGGGVALGHRRLSIIDVACGHQPLANEDETVWIVFNGEIYNFRDLRRRLEGAGHRFRTTSDTETIVHLYEDEGIDCFRHLNGMFALAIWDARQRQLVLARDRLGKKPLFYRADAQRLLFASELKSILTVPGVPREVDPAAIDAYLTYQYIPHPRTILQGVAKLPPAHWATFRQGRVETGCYWRPDFQREIDRPAGEYREELQATLRDAVRLRLESEVPLGAFLSGGIDSSIVVGLMQREMTRPVKTFSIGFTVPEYDETHYARAVAARLGTEHHEFRVEPRSLEVLPKLAWHFDEPFADSSAIPTWYVAQLAREQVTVALTGDGGDELFAGYDRYQAVRLGSWFDRLPAGLQWPLTTSLWQRLPVDGSQRSWRRRFKRLVGALALPPGRRYLEWIAIFGEARRAALYTDAFLAALPDADPYGFLDAALARSSRRDRVTATALADLTTYLPCDLLTKVDIAAMAHGLECRQPLLDYRVVELAAAMPLRDKLRGRRGKAILRDAFGDLLPPDVLRRRKMGFGVPLAEWFRKELKDYAYDVLLAERALARGYFRRDSIAALVDEHVRGVFDHGYRLWALLVLELWHREWIDGPATLQPAPQALFT
ncbi:MAG: asparagine synthase (glutamine-hydrolyzing) [Pirellulales bacterium]|nr:asparagine synthase (glutamine-hydrolyzing) [Pirellulales bacterium]